MIIGLKKDKLLWMAGEITLARRRIREAVHLMQHDEDREFFASCYRFEKSQFKNFERFYLFESPEFIDSIRHGDHDAIAEALLFLEADPYCFRSGYMKKKLCHALKQAPLEKEERFRIRALILKAVCVQKIRKIPRKKRRQMPPFPLFPPTLKNLAPFCTDWRRFSSLLRGKIFLNA